MYNLLRYLKSIFSWFSTLIFILAVDIQNVSINSSMFHPTTHLPNNPFIHRSSQLSTHYLFELLSSVLFLRVSGGWLLNTGSTKLKMSQYSYISKNQSISWTIDPSIHLASYPPIIYLNFFPPLCFVHQFYSWKCPVVGCSKPDRRSWKGCQPDVFHERCGPAD